MAVTLLLMRHGKVSSHLGDIPITPEGWADAVNVGRHLSGRALGRCVLLAAPTRRAIETVQALREGLLDCRPDLSIPLPRITDALRNPDLFLAGTRVEMVSSAEAFAEQVPGLSQGDVLATPFFQNFLSAPDRIAAWLYEPAPPGDDVAAVARRVVAFARSFNWPGVEVDTVLAVTHSPVLRALSIVLLGEDPGEPPHLHGLALSVGEQSLSAAVFDPLAG
jgi:broad specificity phosphatase PhoE